MGPQRASRRKAVITLSDEEEESAVQTPSTHDDDEIQPAKTAKRTSKKPISVKSAARTQQQTLRVSSQDGGPQTSPAKASTIKPKGKSAAKDPPKSTGRPIYSFFNAATSRPRSSQPSASPEKQVFSQEGPEAIHDDSDDQDGSGLRLSNGSSTALAFKKRKVQHGDSFESESSLPPPASQKFRKTSSGDRVPSMTVLNEDKRPWTEQFAPKDISELGVHKRKVADVRQWLDMTMSGRKPKVLVLKGAAGTGKTITVQLLAKERGLPIMEWKNPAGSDLAPEGSVSTASQFKDFVGRAGRAGGLTFATHDDKRAVVESVKQDVEQSSQNSSHILLVEEFPNTYSRSSNTLQSFRSTILEYLTSHPLLDTGVSPIIMIVSETLLSTNTALADSFTAHRLLGPELVNHPYLDTIEFNAVAPTILTKALETIILKEARKSGRRKTPGPLVLKHLSESGDVRSAVSSLEFMCLRGDDGDTWSSKVNFTKQKKGKTDPPLTKSEEEALKLITNRESTLGIFHAVGKIVYNKRVDPRSQQDLAQPPPWFPQHRREKVPENSVDELIEELGTDIPTFIAGLHENYVLSSSSGNNDRTLDSLANCADHISEADLLSVDRFSFGTRAFSGSATDSLRQDEIAFHTAVRGLMFDLPFPVHRSRPPDGAQGDAYRMFYPNSLKLWRKREEIESMLDLLVAKVQSGRVLGDVRGERGEAAVGAGGVESWKRNQSFDTPSSTAKQDALPKSSAKLETLLETLPYAAHIMSTGNAASKLLDQIKSVTRIRGSVPVDDEDDAEMDDGDTVATEAWTTDRPDTEVKLATPKKPQRGKPKLTEGGGLAIPVESRVEKLVLEDDDIVDD